MENNEKYDFIKEKLNEESEEMPSSLSRENILAELENVTQPQKIKVMTPKRIIGLAASFAIVVLSVIAVRFINPPEANKVDSDSSTMNTTLPHISEITDTRTENNTEPSETLDNSGQVSTTLSSDEADNEYDDIIKYFISFRRKASDEYLLYSGSVGKDFVEEGVTSSGVTESYATTYAPAMNEGAVVDKNSSAAPSSSTARWARPTTTARRPPLQRPRARTVGEAAPSRPLRPVRRPASERIPAAIAAARRRNPSPRSVITGTTASLPSSRPKRKRAKKPLPVAAAARHGRRRFRRKPMSTATR